MAHSKEDELHLPYLKKGWTIWEPAAGTGYLADELERLGFDVIATDKFYDQKDIAWDFLTDKPPYWDCIITNPPFSLKQQFLELETLIKIKRN